MKETRQVFVLACLCMTLTSCKSQNPFGADQLTLKQAVALPGVRGRIDHMDVNLKARVVYISALGNNSLEVVDIRGGQFLESIKDLDEPQGVIFIPETGEVMVANGGDGNCKFYSESTLENAGTVALGSDADDVRYDATAKRIYVGYGAGGIAVIDAVRHQKIADCKLLAHPEGFQIDRHLNRLFVNLPGAGQVAVVDLEKMTRVTNWKTKYGDNFPMAIDTLNHTIFIGFRHPARLVAMDELTGATIATASLSGDTDDLFFDGRESKIYASGGSGAIDIYNFEKRRLSQVAHIPTKSGARTSLLIPELSTFLLAERADGRKPAQIEIFNTR